MISARSVRLIAMMLCVVGFGSALAAQATQISGSGCAGAGRLGFGGPPRLGTTMIAVYSCGNYTSVPVMVFGPELTPMVALPPSVVCPLTPCYLACQPVVALPGFVGNSVVVQLPIPATPALIGACLGAQGVCLEANCLTLSAASRICVQS